MHLVFNVSAVGVAMLGHAGLKGMLVLIFILIWRLT